MYYDHARKTVAEELIDAKRFTVGDDYTELSIKDNYLNGLSPYDIQKIPKQFELDGKLRIVKEIKLGYDFPEQYELESELDFPEYDAFLNFFKDIVKTIENTNNVYLIDQIVKFVFVNLVVGDKKVLGYELSEPFKTYNSLKILSGVDDGA